MPPIKLYGVIFIFTFTLRGNIVVLKELFKASVHPLNAYLKAALPINAIISPIFKSDMGASKALCNVFHYLAENISAVN